MKQINAIAGSVAGSVSTMFYYCEGVKIWEKAWLKGR
jgi:hypothetical protein